MDLNPLLVYNLDTDIVKNAFSKVSPAIDDHKYERAVESASAALNKIQEFLITTLDHRSYALGMSSRFDEAVKDAQSMITYQPSLARGYLRLGEIYRMQGKQRNAIEVYNQGLQNVSVDDPHYPQIANGKESATKQNETRIDFVAKLPVEIVGEIVVLLPEETKPAFWSVSKEWRFKISKCSTVWEILTSGDGTKTDWTTSIMPHVATHVKDLTISTKNRGVFLHYLRAMKDGKFRKLKSLKVYERATRHINTEAKPFATAISAIHTTLTSLVIHLNESSAVVPLTSLLSTCSKLRRIEYSTPSYLSHAIGEFTPPDFEISLVEMKLSARAIVGQDLQKLLPFCQQVRCLLLHGCYPSVMDVVDTICPNLVTFGYDPLDVMIPRIEPSYVQNPVPGLCRLYTRNGGLPEPAARFLPLIQRNMLSLKELHTNISTKDSPESLPMVFEELELRSLERLTLWGHDEVMVTLISMAISTCTALTHLEIVASRDLSGLVDRLIALPQLETFGLSYDFWEVIAESDLVRLFDAYAKDMRPGRRLRTCWFRHCEKDVTKRVISALAGVQTLEDIAFEYLSNIEAADLDEFFKTRGNSLSRIKLVDMDHFKYGGFRDDSLAVIGSHSNNLKSIHLEKLEWVTNKGIVQLVDQAPMLQNLTIVNCRYINEVAITHAKKKVENVVVAYDSVVN